jgi:hypothetical protein
MRTSIETVAASPESILEVIRDSHRHQSAFDPEADPSADLCFETSVAEWSDACDLVRTEKLGEALNEIWNIDVSPAAWRAVLEPSRKRTLRNVCDLISVHAKRAVIEPAGAFGSSCRSAGAFLAVRALLLKAGAQEDSIRPSQPIAEVARRHPEIFLGPISRLAPGRLPTVAIRSPLSDAAVAAAVLGLIVALATVSFSVALALAALAVVALATVAMWALSRRPPRTVQFGRIMTFRDLAETMAGEDV